MVVTGASGQLGTAFRRVLPPGATFLARPELDLRVLEAIAPVLEAADPGVLLNCAAYTAVDRAEDEEEIARTVNAIAVERMARFAAARGIPFVTYSTDYVFDGLGERPYVESDKPQPAGAYGRTKAEGEEAALAAYPRALVIRTSWVISGSHPNFVSAILRKARSGPLRVVDDQRGRPTIAADLAAATLAVLEGGATGLLHLANEGETTWFGLARAALAEAGMDPEVVSPCRTDEYPTRARRPAYGVLGSERAALLPPTLPHWRDSLPAVVREMLEWL